MHLQTTQKQKASGHSSRQGGGIKIITLFWQIEVAQETYNILIWLL